MAAVSWDRGLVDDVDADLELGVATQASLASVTINAGQASYSTLDGPNGRCRWLASEPQTAKDPVARDRLISMWGV
jgi:hypothetical protein